MRDKVKKILDEVYKNKYFNQCGVSLTINYEEIINGSDKILNDKSYKEIIDILDRVDIETYNITFRTIRGVNRCDGEYDLKWKSVDFIFYGNNDKYGNFVFNSLNNFDSINTSTVYQLSKDRDMKYDSYKYDDISKVIDIMIDLDKLIDKQMEEKLEIYNRIKLLDE